MPKPMDWRAMLECAKECGYDFVEISIDETDLRLSRLDWSKEQLRPNVGPAPQCIQDKHFMRKHGPNAYYGQKK